MSLFAIVACLAAPMLLCAPDELPFVSSHLDSGGIASFGLRSADLDGDTWPDIVIGAQASPSPGNSTWHVYLGGQGGLSPGLLVPLEGHATDFELADVSGDGLPDIVSARKNAQEVSVRHGAGDGTFAAPTVYDVSGFPSVVALGDVDGDGDLDALISSFDSPRVTALINDGTGAFPIRVDSLATSGMQLVLGDIDADGSLDALLGKAVLLGGGDGSFTVGPTLSGPGIANAFLVDLTRDGLLDLLGLYAGDLYVFEGLGDGTFGSGVVTQLADPMTALNVADFDEDGHPDVGAVIQTNSSGFKLAVLRNDGHGMLLAPILSSVAYGGELIVVDVDQDGDVDVVSRPPDSVAAVVFGTGDGAFADAGQFTFGAHALAIADMDGDGLADAVSTANQNVQVLFGEGAGSFGAAINEYTPRFPDQLVVADFIEDGVPDVFTSQDEGTLGWLLFQGLGGGELVEFAGAGSNLFGELRSADANGDGHADVFGLDGTVDGLAWLLTGDGAGGFASTAIAGGAAADDLRAMDIGDVDLDGDVDLLLLEAEHLYARLGNGDGTFALVTNELTCGGGCVPRAIGIGDVDADGLPDAYVARGAQLIVMKGAGNGTFTKTWQDGESTIPVRELLTADLDGDGDDDVVSTPRGRYWLSNGDGTVSGAQAPGLAPTTPVDVALSDIDGDGAVDLLALSGARVISAHNQLGPWRGLGHPLPGALATPTLRGTGPLVAGKPFALALSGASPFAPAFLLIGDNTAFSPFHGGVLVPAPVAALPLAIDGTGAAGMSGTWPADLPTGASVIVQAWLVDAMTQNNYSASGALRVTTP